MKTRDEDIAMMKNDAEWPVWPVLPLKRHVSNMLDVGVLISGHGPIVFTVSMFEVSGYKSTSEMPQKVYTDYDGILDDGWVVD